MSVELAEGRDRDLSLSVVIPVYNAHETLGKTLAAAFASDYPDFEVIVVDDCSTDQSREIAGQFPARLIRQPRNSGVASARNKGAEEAKGEIIVFIDSDIVLAPDSLRKFADAFLSDPEIQVVGGVMASALADKRWGVTFIGLKSVHILDARHKGKAQYESCCFPSYAGAVTKGAFEEVGGFDTSLAGIGGEDYDLGLRLSKHHRIVYFTDIKVGHLYLPLFRKLKQWFKRSRRVLLPFLRTTGRKDNPNGPLEQFSVMLVMLSLLALILASFFPPLLWASLGTFLLSVVINYHFYYFVASQKNMPFAFYSIICNTLYYLTVGIGISLALARFMASKFVRTALSPIDGMRFLLSRTPPYVILFVTSRCNNRCNYCFNWQRQDESAKRQELTLDEIRKVSKSLGHIKYLAITGGEPTLRDDIPEICEAFYKNNSAHIINMHTNGYLPEKIVDITREILVRCPHSFLMVQVTLDGLPETHDAIRGVKGGFDKAVKTLRHLLPLADRFPNLGLRVGTTYTAYNRHEMVPLHEFVVNELELKHSINIVRGDVRDPRSKDITMEEYHEAMKELRLDEQFKERDKHAFAGMKEVLMRLAPEENARAAKLGRMTYPCVAGKKVIVIGDTGDLYPCEILNKSFGNVRQGNYNLRKMLKSKEAEKIFSFIRNSNCYCTWECILPINLVFNLKAWPLVFKTWFKLKFKKKPTD
ncbi:MAG: glycosyltransferase [Candidatus Coatesbacteria bacterium]|nr:glycosyltransferase [Candidatus Coatesbacteria bacterium]